jgi:hypothetical protein
MTGRNQRRTARTRAGSAQNHATRRDPEPAGEFVASRRKLNCAAKPGGVGRKRRNIIQGHLDTRAIVAFRRRHTNAGRDERYRHAAAAITGSREIRHAVASRIDFVDERTVFGRLDGRSDLDRPARHDGRDEKQRRE